MKINSIRALFNYRIFNRSIAQRPERVTIYPLTLTSKYRGISSLVCPCEASVIRTQSLFLELSEEEFAKKYKALIQNSAHCSHLFLAFHQKDV